MKTMGARDMTVATLRVVAVLSALTLGACPVDAATIQAGGQFVTVNTTSGQLRGKVDQDLLKPVVKFLGVPFARPPIGDLRFSAPLKPSQWPGVRDALQLGNDCMQRQTRYNTGARNRSEDCLYLNVYSPSVAGSLPVMVWVHGGGYYLGTGSIYDGTSLAAKDVVIVTINYRLDVFGFLSTEDDAMPGNYGMMDQVAALSWVQDNIASFGGDPRRVTVFGQSAGAASVSLLVLSPLTKGMFQKAITQSGASLAPWTINYPGNALSPKVIARLVSSQVYCQDLDNTTNLLSCLQSIDSDTLMDASTNINKAVGSASQLIMLPRVETVYGFLPDSPLNLIRQGKFNKVDRIHGINSDEMGAAMLLYLNKTQISSTEEAETAIKDNLLQFNQLEQNNLLRLVKSFHHLNTPSNSTEVLEKQTVNAIDDFTFASPAAVEIHEIAQRSPTTNNFLYQFNYKASFFNWPDWMSATHGGELAMVFNVSRGVWSKLHGGQPNDDDVAMSNQMMEMWTNFAKTGDPTSSVPVGGAQWKPYTLTDEVMLQINSTSAMSRSWKLYKDVVPFYFKFMQSLDSNLNTGTSSTIIR